MVSKNAQIDKSGKFEFGFKNLFGNSFIFGKSDSHWKAKRKGLAHAFYKDKLISMLDILKDYVFEAQNRWLAEMKASDEKSTKIDLTKEILQIKTRFINHIIFGSNVDEIKVPFKSKGTQE